MQAGPVCLSSNASSLLGRCSPGWPHGKEGAYAAYTRHIAVSVLYLGSTACQYLALQHARGWVHLSKPCVGFARECSRCEGQSVLPRYKYLSRRIVCWPTSALVSPAESSYEQAGFCSLPLAHPSIYACTVEYCSLERDGCR